jgi:hypothetical protein
VNRRAGQSSDRGAAAKPTGAGHAGARRQAACLRGVEQCHPLLGGQGDEQIHHINAPVGAQWTGQDRAGMQEGSGVAGKKGRDGMCGRQVGAGPAGHGTSVRAKSSWLAS